MTATDQAVSLARTAAQAASDKLATDLIAYDVSDQLAITDIFVVATAATERQVGAVTDAVLEKLRDDLDTRPIRREGDQANRWVLLDYGDIVVHVQHSEERTFYALERLWGDCPEIDLDLDEEPGSNDEAK